jgi:SprB repeat
MKKFLTILLLFAFFKSMAQIPIIKAKQYTVVVERTITHNAAYFFRGWSDQYPINIPSYLNHTLSASGYNYYVIHFSPISWNIGLINLENIDGQYGIFPGFSPFGYGNPNSLPPAFNYYQTTHDAAWQANQAAQPNNDKSIIELYKNGIPNGAFSEIQMSLIPRDSTKIFRDTISLYENQFDVSQIDASIIEEDILECGAALQYFPGNNPYYAEIDLTKHNFIRHQISFTPDGSLYDSSQTSSSSSSGRYDITTRVKVIPNADPSINLPSHDDVELIQTTPIYNPNSYNNFTPVWEYRLPPYTGPFIPVPAGNTSGVRGEILTISGFKLLGANCMNYLNENVQIRIAPVPYVASDITVLTLRLSSPHITNITPYHLNCYDRNEGSLKIKFDRQLIEGEKLNIFLYDTVNRINYSSFNITQLNVDELTFTWPNELNAGLYGVSLLGKFSKGIAYNLDVYNRIDTIPTYKALLSVNFLDSFNTTNLSDFEAFTDYDGYSKATYTGGYTHFGFKTLTEPEKIRFSVRVDSNVLCKGTAGGVISITAKGGLNFPNNKKYYKYSLKHADSATYSNFVWLDSTNLQTLYNPNYTTYSGIQQQISNLRAGSYLMHLRDSVDCFAKDSVGLEVTYPFTITEPARGITIDSLVVLPITSSDSANGRFNIKISGGTVLNTTNTAEALFDEAYIIQLRDSATNALLLDHINYTDTTINNVYNMITGNLQEATYILRVFDKSYRPNDPYNAGCYLELKIPFKKPQPLNVDIAKAKQISCYNDSDGQLVANGTGGVRLDSLPYQYFWYKLLSNGTSIALPTSTDTLIKVKDSTLSGLKIGTYRVEIKDRFNNVKSDTFQLTQPLPISLQFTTTPASCYSSIDGSMRVIATGGTQFADTAHRYAYEWSNGALSDYVPNVAGGKYLIVVRDTMGCLKVDSVSVISPVRVIAKDSLYHPISCYNTNDGVLNVSAVGGTGSYTYTWGRKDSVTTVIANTATISNLTPGTYWYKVADGNGCFDTDTITLTRPDTILVNLGPNRLLCKGQSIKLDGTVQNATTPMTYTWTASNSNNIIINAAKAKITGAGTFVIAVSNTTGCTIRDTIIVTTSADSVNTDFVVSTQVFKNEPVVLVNLSYPSSQDSMLWIVPSLGNSVSILTQNNLNAKMLFADTGRFEIGMKVYYHNGCIDDTAKYVNVINNNNLNNLGSQANAYLKLYAVIVPNPTPGTFDVNMTFSEATRARLRVINTLTNATVDTREIVVPNSSVFSEHYVLNSAIPAGVYILVIETPKGNFVYKIVKV